MTNRDGLPETKPDVHLVDLRIPLARIIRRKNRQLVEQYWEMVEREERALEG